MRALFQVGRECGYRDLRILGQPAADSDRDGGPAQEQGREPAGGRGIGLDAVRRDLGAQQRHAVAGVQGADLHDGDVRRDRVVRAGLRIARDDHPASRHAAGKPLHLTPPFDVVQHEHAAGVPECGEDLLPGLLGVVDRPQWEAERAQDPLDHARGVLGLVAVLPAKVGVVLPVGLGRQPPRGVDGQRGGAYARHAPHHDKPPVDGAVDHFAELGVPSDQRLDA